MTRLRITEAHREAVMGPHALEELRLMDVISNPTSHSGGVVENNSGRHPSDVFSLKRFLILLFWDMLSTSPYSPFLLVVMRFWIRVKRDSVGAVPDFFREFPVIK